MADPQQTPDLARGLPPGWASLTLGERLVTVSRRLAAAHVAEAVGRLDRPRPLLDQLARAADDLAAERRKHQATDPRKDAA